MTPDPLVAFLEARLDEAEHTVYQEGSPPVGVIAWLTYLEPDGSPSYTTVASGGTPEGPWIADGGELPDPASVLVVYDPIQVLRQIEASRAIVRRCAVRMNEPDQWPNGLVSPRALLARQVLRDMAAVYSDHPDYRQEWAL